MKFVISAVINGQKIELLVSGDDKELVENFKQQMCRMVMAQVDWVSEMRVEGP